MTNTEANDQQIFDFLHELREEGSMNMFGAPAVIRDAFGLGKAESYEIFERWTETFDQ